MKTNTTLSVSILSGKGGVGKTNLALNLGYCLNKGGHPLLLMDCDLGLANLDVLLGIAPDKTLQDLLADNLDPDAVTVSLDKGGFDFLPAASGVPELVDMDSEMRAGMLRKLRPMFGKYDFLFLDVGAGINPTVLAFATMSTMRVIVVTPEPTSLTDSYALIKVLNTQHGLEDFYVIVNQAENRNEEKQTFARLHAACERFLDIDIKPLGGVLQDKAVPEAVRHQVPLMRRAPQSKAGQDIFAIARKIQAVRREMLPQIEESEPLGSFPARQAG